MNPTLKRILLCALTLLLLCGGWLGVTGMTLPVAFVPMLMISRSYGPGRRNMWKMFGWAGLTFATWNFCTVLWVKNAAWIGVTSSTAIEFLLFGGVFTLYHYASKRTPKSLAYTLLVAGWIACEHIYTVGQISFPWLTLGNGFANDIALVQWYDTTGVFGGSLWVWICNLLIFEAATSRRRAMAVAAALAVLLPITVSLVRYFTYEESGRPVKFTIVQPNIDPYNKFGNYEEQYEIFFSLMAEAPVDVDYIVMPETAIQTPGLGMLENTISDNSVARRFLGFMEENYPAAQLITGAQTWKIYAPGEKPPHTARHNRQKDYYYDKYNSALAVDAAHGIQIYHKSKLLVGVEMTPFDKFVKEYNIVILDMGGVAGQLGYDLEPKVFDGPRGLKTGGSICWEGVYGEYYGRFAAEGADAMAIISNDGWWGDTPGYKQLFRFSQLRALESRRAIARSANTGKSGFISQRGDELSSIGWDVRGTLTGTIFTNDRVTFYSRYGDYIARACNLVFILGLLYLVAYRIRRRNYLAGE